MKADFQNIKSNFTQNTSDMDKFQIVGDQKLNGQQSEFFDDMFAR